MASSEAYKNVSDNIESSRQLVDRKEVLSRNPIKRLDKDVADRIAAGEVILRPASVVKELLENSIDAHATQIEVSLLEGGLKTIKFKDNGEGIHPDDLTLLCERFATSKLTRYEDLLSLSTFGFRGEALASISFVSHLTVTTMKEDSDFAYQAYFENGQLVPSEKLGSINPKKCSGVKGTTFIVEDLFYNCPLRRRSLSNPKEEYRYIIDLLMKYSIRYNFVSFSCRRLENSKSDFFTPCVDSELTSIANVFGKELVEEMLEIGPLTSSFSFHGYVTNANFSLRKPQYLFFVNGRLVEWQCLKRAISSLYSSLLPKGGHPFIYLDIAIDPHRLDVNVHPAKRQIFFLDEDKLVETLLNSIETKLTLNSSSRNFPTVSLRDTSFRESIDSFASLLEKQTSVTQDSSRGKHSQGYSVEDSCTSSHTSVPSSTSWMSTKEKRPYKKIRSSIHYSNCNLDMFLATNLNSDSKLACEDIITREGSSNQDSINVLQLSKDSDQSSFHNVDCSLATDDNPDHNWDRDSVLSLIRERLQTFERDCHDGIKKMLNESVFVGSVDEDHILVQYQTKLFWINLTHLSKRMFFQKVRKSFHSSLPGLRHELFYQSLKMVEHFGTVAVSSKISVFQSILMHINNSLEECELQRESRFEIGKEICAMLSKYRNLLLRYFAITFEGNLLSNFYLTALPKLCDEFSFQECRIGEFLFRLGGETRWHNFELFLEDVCEALSYLFSCSSKFKRVTTEISTSSACISSGSGDFRWQRTVLELLRNNFEPPKECATNGDVVEITSLERLYRVFERC